MLFLENVFDKGQVEGRRFFEYFVEKIVIFPSADDFGTGCFNLRLYRSRAEAGNISLINNPTFGINFISGS